MKHFKIIFVYFRNIETIHPNHTSDDWVFLLKPYKIKFLDRYEEKFRKRNGI